MPPPRRLNVSRGVIVALVAAAAAAGFAAGRSDVGGPAADRTDSSKRVASASDARGVELVGRSRAVACECAPPTTGDGPEPHATSPGGTGGVARGMGERLRDIAALVPEMRAVAVRRLVAEARRDARVRDGILDVVRAGPTESVAGALTEILRYQPAGKLTPAESDEVRGLLRSGVPAQRAAGAWVWFAAGLAVQDDEAVARLADAIGGDFDDEVVEVALDVAHEVAFDRHPAIQDALRRLLAGSRDGPPVRRAARALAMDLSPTKRLAWVASMWRDARSDGRREELARAFADVAGTVAAPRGRGVEDAAAFSPDSAAFVDYADVYARTADSDVRVRLATHVGTALGYTGDAWASALRALLANERDPVVRDRLEGAARAVADGRIRDAGAVTDALLSIQR